MQALKDLGIIFGVVRPFSPTAVVGYAVALTAPSLRRNCTVGGCSEPAMPMK